MLCVRAAAAAAGLPEDTKDFHLSIGRHLARIHSDILRSETHEQAARENGQDGIAIIRAAIDNLCDREDTLIRALAALPAETLAGAAVQVAAAIKLLSVMSIFEDRRADDERAVRRLLDSAVTVMIDAAGIDPVRDGVAELSEQSRSTWRDPFDVVAEIFPGTASEGQIEAIDH
ncbi:hypothetical protein OIU35_24460 [Boseaceae bacterium BT-24-1]|nr:hypothetical protein [Boseaceae bacterium BT-24-1]